MAPQIHDILLVEDNPGDARLIRELLTDEVGREGFRMRDAGTLADALLCIHQQLPHLVVLDLSLPDSFGLETLYRIQDKDASLPVVVLTGNEDQELALAAVKAGAQDYLVKHELSGRLLLKTLQYARERKQNEATLRVSEARFRSLAELSSDWYWEQDADHRLTYLSDGLLEKSGVDPSVLLGCYWWEISRTGDENDWGPLMRAMQARQPFQDYVFRHATDGADTLHISISGVPVFDNGVFAGFRGLGKDVSSRERAAADLRGSEERFRQILDTGRDCILFLDAGGNISFTNRRAASLFDIEESGLRGRKLDDLLTQDSNATPGANGSGEALAVRRTDGSTVFVMESRYPVSGPDGSHAGTLAILTDLTEYKQREERVRELASLATQKSEAERASHAKSRFMAAVSHDLRQPMHALGLFIDDLKSAELPAPSRLVVGHMESALQVTQSLLDSILIMSRLETGMIAPNFMSFPIDPMLARLRSGFGAVARRNGLRFVVASSEAVVFSDPALLERVMTNLVSNAMRYTKRGGVIVACRPWRNSVRLEVWDTGAGIPEEHREAVFREFFRIERDQDNRAGLGLGLAIVRSCTRLLGTNVELRSVAGQGSRFSLNVPFGRLSAPLAGDDDGDANAEDDVSDQRFDGLRVLLVDDDALILEGTRSLLERWGCHVIAAASGPEADARLDRESRGPDFIISDLRLDGGELGVDIVGHMRKRYRPNLPAVLISGDTSLQTARFVRGYGLALLYKPVPPIRLRALLAALHAS